MKDDPEAKNKDTEGSTVPPDEIVVLACRLFVGLDQILKRKISSPSPVLAEQKRTVMLLQEVAKFIGQAWLPPGNTPALQRFAELAAIFEQLGDGVQHPLVKAHPPGKGAPDDRAEIWIGRKWVCLAHECYLKTDECKNKPGLAAKLIADKPANRPLKRLIRYATERSADKNRAKDLASAILSWHKVFDSGLANYIAQAQFAQAVKYLNQSYSSDPWGVMAEKFLVLGRREAQKIALKPA
jgi:hypothetical protein